MALTKISRSLLDTGVSDSSDATAITIDSSERVMIGTTDAGYPDYGDSLTLGDVDGGGGNAGMTIRSGTSSYGTLYFSDDTGTALGAYAGKLQYYHSDNSMALNTSSYERLRIDTSGRMFLGATSGFGSGFFEVNASPTNFNHIVTRPTVNATYNALRMINNANTVIGTISVGTSVNTVTYGGTSDYRLKENIQPMEQGLERVKKLNPVKFDWKETGESSEGFIAHEIQDAGWNLGVVGKKDGKEMQEVEYGKLTPLLVKAIQEQQAIIEDLQTQINEVKNGN